MSSVYEDRCVIKDSKSRAESFVRKGRNGHYESDISSVLGYINSSTVIVFPERTAMLLDYIDSIEVSNGYIKDSIPVCYGRPKLTGDNIMCYFNGSLVYDVLDWIMCASYSERFAERLSHGVLSVKFGSDWHIVCSKITFCGDYMGAVAKLMMLYRGTAEFQSKLSRGGAFPVLKSS